MSLTNRYKHDSRMDWLTLPHPWESVSGSEEAEKAAQFREDHPHLSEWKEVSVALIRVCSRTADGQGGVPPVPLQQAVP